MTVRIPEPRRVSKKTAARAVALACCTAAFLALDFSSAYAQIEEVVVTARKRAENVQNIPVAVTAISGEQVAQFNLTSVQDISQATPQLLISRGSSGSGSDITMRGIGSSFENIGIEQSVAVNVDGVYYGQGRAIDEGIFDVSGVQVMKGPQALFYGKNATAGALAFQTNDPTDQYQAMLTAGYEFTAEEPYVEGIASGPVADDLGLRIAARVSDQSSGYLKQTAGAGSYTTFDVATGHFNTSPTATPPDYLGGEKDALVRLTGKWTPTSELTVTLKATYDQVHSNNNADNVVNVYCPLGYAQSDPTQTPCGRKFQAQQPALPLDIADVPGSLEGKKGGQDFNIYQSGTLYANVNYATTKYSLTSTTAFQHLFNDWSDNQNFTAANSVYAGEHFDWDQFSTEERFNTSFDYPVNFAGGVYFQNTTLNFNQDVDFAAAQNTAAPLLDEFVAYNKQSATGGHTYAAFGQVIWDIVPELEFTGGARYTHEIKSSYFLQPYVNPTLQFLFVPYNPAMASATEVVADQHFDNLSPEATLTWKPDSDLTLYAAYKTGYKSGGFSNSAILSTLTQDSDLRFKPEKVKGVELGVKSIWLDNQLRLNADVFNFLYTDLQVDFFNTPTFNYVTLNAASARTQGFEYQADYAPAGIEGLLIHLDGAYDDSHYNRFEAPCYPAGLTYEEGCNALRVPGANGNYSFSSACGSAAVNCDFMNVNGGPTSLSPKWTTVVGEDYNMAIGSHWKLGFASDVRLSSGYVANPFPSKIAEQIDRQAGYAMIDAVLSFGSADGTWRASVIGRNLANNFVATNTQGLPLSGGVTGCKVATCGVPVVSDQGATVDDPRTVAIQFTYRY